MSFSGSSDSQLSNIPSCIQKVKSDWFRWHHMISIVAGRIPSQYDVIWLTTSHDIPYYIVSWQVPRTPSPVRPVSSASLTGSTLPPETAPVDTTARRGLTRPPQQVAARVASVRPGSTAPRGRPGPSRAAPGPTAPVWATRGPPTVFPVPTGSTVATTTWPLPPVSIYNPPYWFVQKVHQKLCHVT
jgi:hypothetical protein